MKNEIDLDDARAAAALESDAKTAVLTEKRAKLAAIEQKHADAKARAAELAQRSGEGESIDDAVIADASLAVAAAAIEADTHRAAVDVAEGEQAKAAGALKKARWLIAEREVKKIGFAAEADAYDAWADATATWLAKLADVQAVIGQRIELRRQADTLKSELLGAAATPYAFDLAADSLTRLLGVLPGSMLTLINGLPISHADFRKLAVETRARANG